MKKRILALTCAMVLAISGTAVAAPSNGSGPSNGNADFLGQGQTTADKAPAARPGNS
jgi:hypothetical protein